VKGGVGELTPFLPAGSRQLRDINHGLQIQLFLVLLKAV